MAGVISRISSPWIESNIVDSSNRNVFATVARVHLTPACNLQPVIFRLKHAAPLMRATILKEEQRRRLAVNRLDHSVCGFQSTLHNFPGISCAFDRSKGWFQGPFLSWCYETGRDVSGYVSNFRVRYRWTSKRMKMQIGFGIGSNIANISKRMRGNDLKTGIS